VEKLVAGPGVFICNTCVEFSAAVIADTANESPEQSARRAEFADRSAADVLSYLPALARSAAQVETQLARWVGRLREQGIDWQQIADALGVSVEAVQQRFETRPSS
jgi:ATP-dependent Clp protease ATP-binding subunit ClpX